VYAVGPDGPGDAASVLRALSCASSRTASGLVVSLLGEKVNGIIVGDNLFYYVMTATRIGGPGRLPFPASNTRPPHRDVGHPLPARREIEIHRAPLNAYLVASDCEQFLESIGATGVISSPALYPACTHQSDLESRVLSCRDAGSRIPPHVLHFASGRAALEALCDQASLTRSSIRHKIRRRLSRQCPQGLGLPHRWCEDELAGGIGIIDPRFP